MGRPVLHLPIVGAATAVLYAGSLGVVAVLQGAHDVAVVRERAPWVDGAHQAAVERSATLDAIEAANEALAGAAAGYDAALARSHALDASLATLAERVGVVTGAAAQLPASVVLPAAPRAAAIAAPVAAPATHATTGASGH